jgi:hypothetical protein
MTGAIWVYSEHKLRKLRKMGLQICHKTSKKLDACIEQECTGERGQLGITGGQEVRTNMYDHITE